MASMTRRVRLAFDHMVEGKGAVLIVGDSHILRDSVHLTAVRTIGLADQVLTRLQVCDGHDARLIGGDRLQQLAISLGDLEGSAGQRSLGVAIQGPDDQTRDGLVGKPQVSGSILVDSAHW